MDTEKEFARSEGLVAKGAVPRQQWDTDEVRLQSTRAALQAANSQLLEAQATSDVAQSQVVEGQTASDAALGRPIRLQADINDSLLKARHGGRVQHRVAQPGEVVSAGGKIRGGAGERTGSVTNLYATPARSMPQFGLLALPLFIVMNLLCGDHTPLDSMPPFLQTLMQMVPSTHFVSFAQAILFRGAGLAIVWPAFATTAAISAVFFAGALARFRKTITEM